MDIAGKRTTRLQGLLLVALLSAFPTAGRLAAATPPPDEGCLLGGALTWCDSLGTAWPMCGHWVYPVGDSLDPENEGTGGTPRFLMTRGVTWGRGRHDGADLSNRRAGDRVRAAASGLVAYADSTGFTDYGVHAVVAHRLEDGGIVATVYSHLELGSLRVAEGDSVQPGQWLGRVGRTGRATSPHLHFEIRRIQRPTDSWLLAHPLDPMSFIAARLPSLRDSSLATRDSSGTRATAAAP